MWPAVYVPCPENGHLASIWPWHFLNGHKYHTTYTSDGYLSPDKKNECMTLNVVAVMGTTMGPIQGNEEHTTTAENKYSTTIYTMIFCNMLSKHKRLEQAGKQAEKNLYNWVSRNTLTCDGLWGPTSGEKIPR